MAACHAGPVTPGRTARTVNAADPLRRRAVRPRSPRCLRWRYLTYRGSAASGQHAPPLPAPAGPQVAGGVGRPPWGGHDVALPAWGTAASDRLGYDGAGRTIAKRFVASALDGGGAYADTTPVVAFTTAFDKASNKQFERDLHAENRSHLYQPTPGIGPVVGGNTGGVDSLNRLLQYQRGTLAGGGGSVTTPITLPGTDSFRGYELDHLGNWKRTTYTATPPAHESSSSSSLTSSSSSSSSSSAFHLEDTEVRQHNALNQITRITDGGSTTPFVYDASGDFTDDGTRLMTYDATRGATPAPRRDGHGFAMCETVTRILRDQTWSSHESDRATRRLRVPCYALFGSLGRNMVSVLPVPATLPAGNHPLCTGRGSACCCCINGTT